MSAKQPSKFLDYIFMYSYPVTFVGALFFAVASVFGKTLSDYVSDNRISIGTSIFLGVSAFVSLVYWFNDSNIPIVNNIVNSTSSLYNIETVKTRSNN
jgi:preprotein translocase subunit SecY